jgi:hypothetical protein
MRDAVACQLRLMAHLSGWLAREGLDAAALTAGAVEEFLVFRRAAGHTTLRSPRALEPLLRYLRELGVELPAPVVVMATPVDELLERYRRFLLGERGLAAGTVRGYVDIVRPFLAGRVAADGSGLERLAARDVTAFVLAECPGRSCRHNVHKEQNVLGHLPESERPWVKRKLREAWTLERAELAERRLVELARAREAKRPGAAASLREGLAETLTITRLGMSADSTLGRTLATTNPIESALDLPRARPQRQALARRRDGLRWTAAGMLDAERSFRRVKGFRGLPQLAAALRRHAADVDEKEVRDFPTAA